jgi:hypothetical protein
MNTILYKGRYIFSILLGILCLSLLGCSSDDGGVKTPPQLPTTYTVTFNINGGLYGSFGNTKNVVVSEIEPGTLLGDLPLKPAPVYLDYAKDFAVWNTEADGSGIFYEDYTPIDNDITLHAIYAGDLSALSLEDIECDDPSVIYTLSGSIDFGTLSEPVCEGGAFKGRIYGKNNTIVFTLPAATPAREYAGFFEKLDGALINGLNITGTLSVASSSAGVLAAAVKDSTIEYVTVSGGPQAAAATGAFAGGIAGTLDNSTVRFVNSLATPSAPVASADSAVGGIVGKASNSSVIYSSSASGKISGSAAGGIAGVLEGGSNVTASVSSGILSGETAGGIAGILESSAEISESYTLNPSITGNIAAGGIAGSVDGGSVQDSAALGNLITGDTALGRIAGEIKSGEALGNVFARGDMLINYTVVPSSETGGKNGHSKSISEIRGNREFFEAELGWDMSPWVISEYYEYPKPLGDNYIEIQTVDDFKRITEMGLDKKYILMNDLDFSEVTMWAPFASAFTGVLDGAGHTIKNFWLHGGTASTAIFSTISGTVKNLNLDNISFIPAASNSGNSPSSSFGILANIISSGFIDRVKITRGEIIGGSPTGGIVGYSSGTATNITANIISESSFNGSVKSNNTSQGAASRGAGGIAGTSGTNAYSSITLISCFADAEINSDPVTTQYTRVGAAGGLIGEGSGRINVINSYFTGEINAYGETTSSSGGIVGSLPANSLIVNSYSTGNIMTKGMARTLAIVLNPTAGGLVGGYAGNTSEIKGSIAFADKLIIADNATASHTGATTQLFGKVAARPSVHTSALSLTLTNVFANVDMDTELSTGKPEVRYDSDYDSLVTPISKNQLQSFYEGIGWDFEYTWKMPEGGGLPVLKWEE